MEPVTAGLIAAVATWVIGATVVIFVVIKLADVMKWFSSQVNLEASGNLTVKPIGLDARAKIGFTINEAIESGRVRIVQGVFNKDSKEVVDGRIIEGVDLDDKLKEFHQDMKVVLYP